MAHFLRRGIYRQNLSAHGSTEVTRLTWMTVD